MSLIAEDGLAGLDITVPLQGRFYTSLVHSLWTLFDKSHDVANLSYDDKLYDFFKHLVKLKIIPEVDFIPRSTDTQPIGELSELTRTYQIAGAFDALQRQAQIMTTGISHIARVPAEFYFCPPAFFKRQAHRAKAWNTTRNHFDIFFQQIDHRYMTSRSATSGTSGQMIPCYYGPDGCLPSHYHNAAFALNTIPAVAKYLKYVGPHYCGLPTPFAAITSGCSLALRKPGGDLSLSVSGIYPVSVDVMTSSGPASKFWLPFYTSLRLPTADSVIAEHISQSSSVLINGAFSYARITDEVYYDGATDLLSASLVDGTKVVIIAEVKSDIINADNPLANINTIPKIDSNIKVRSIQGSQLDVKPYACMIPCEYKDGCLRLSDSLLSFSDKEFMKGLTALATDIEVRNCVRSILKD